MKHAAIIAATKAIRTFAQTAAGGLAGATVLTLATDDLKIAGGLVLLSIINAGLAAAVAFLQNFAEALPES